MSDLDNDGGCDTSPEAVLEEGRSAPHFTIPPDELERLFSEHDPHELHQLGGASGLAATLHTHVENGLSSDESASDNFAARISHFGENRFVYPPPKSFFRLVLEAFHDLTIIILCIAAVVSLIIGLAMRKKREEYAYLEGVAIVIVVFVVVLVQAVIDGQKEKKFRQLNSVKDQYEVHVIRGGKTLALTADHLLVGDIVKLAAGDKVPADAVLIEASALKTNESAMTGEPIDISKSIDDDPFLLSGTSISEGVGTVLIVAVGQRSQWGVILKGLIVEPDDTPLQQRLDRLAWTIGKLGIVFAFLTFSVSLIRWIVDSSRGPGRWDFSPVLDFFIDAVTIVVVAIPEGLPLAITLGLAFAMRKMMVDGNYVRRLEACETMGSATQLNADKTGTLTQNRMTIVEANWLGRQVIYDGPMNDPAVDAFLAKEFRDLICVNVATNTQANLEFTDGGLINHLGSKTECALLQHVHKWSLDYRMLRAEHPAFRVYMFDSDRKCMSTAERLGANRLRLHTKGAPEIVLRACSQQLAADGASCTPLDDATREQILTSVSNMARRGLRTLLLAYRDIEHDEQDAEFWSVPPDSEQLVYIGVVGIKDPIRRETKEAVRQLKEAGVSVRMVTGDNALTAEFIAREAGILDDEGIIIEGPRFRELTHEKLERIALRIQVLARSTPADKLLLVRKLKQLGEVTSVTGDGTNDGPALKEADVGFALGIAGTEVAKEASDIVILDDNIQSMTKAVLWGRNVYESIRKFLQFQLVVNVVAVTLNFISACAGVSLPLGAVPLLWVNMIMDSMGALALATEPPRRELMQRKPFGRRAPLINRAMYRNIIGLSLYQLVVSLVLQFRGRDIFGMDCSNEDLCELEINSIIFNVFVFMQIGSEVNSRRIEAKNVFDGIHKSGWFLSIVFVTIVIQVALMIGVGGTTVGNTIGVVRVNGAAWGAALVLGALVIPWGLLVRCIPLDWCYGPLDEDPTEMSKLEKALRIPKRKVATADMDDEMDLDFECGQQSLGKGTEGTGVSSNVIPSDRILTSAAPHGMERSAAKIKLRVFVHAVAFVNVVSRGKIADSTSTT